MTTSVYHQDGVVIAGDASLFIKTLTDCADLRKLNECMHAINCKGKAYTFLGTGLLADLNAEMHQPVINGCEECPKFAGYRVHDCEHRPENQLIMTKGYKFTPLQQAEHIHAARKTLYALIADHYKPGEQNKLQFSTGAHTFLQWIEVCLLKPVMIGKILVISSYARTYDDGDDDD